jgi:hypothetical protein
LDVIPVFVLTGQAGKRFHPLAFKIFAMAGATLLAVPLVLLLSSLQIGSKIRGIPQGAFFYAPTVCGMRHQDHLTGPTLLSPRILCHGAR